ncbi:MAG: hypothetical protein C0506_06200 [Anaerolinea sp.]|nr:hypothetical protein [Anaerolinea sp.]
MAAMTASLRHLIQRVESTPEPLVVRCDDGAPFAGPVVVLPSAFNPPTRAHIHLLETAARSLEATPAALLTTKNVAKEAHGADHLQRVEMLLAACRSLPRLAVLVSNQARIIDQAAVLSAAFPLAEFAMVVGYDTLVRLFDPMYYADMEAELGLFFAAHRLVATNRAEHGIDEVEAYLASVPAAFQGRILALAIDDHHASLSSTAARGHAAQGVDSHALLPEVAEYVRRHRLYRE